MYQWKDPETGTTHLSGVPPAWYRSENHGPRVFVFEKGKMIDDTGINISNEQRDLLRIRALLKADEDIQAAKQKALQSERLKAVLDMQHKDEIPIEEVEIPEGTDTLGETDGDETIEKLPDVSRLTADEMRALILDWERKQTEAAKDLINPDVDSSQNY
jgi:hypothetical protein